MCPLISTGCTSVKVNLSQVDIVWLFEVGACAAHTCVSVCASQEAFVVASSVKNPDMLSQRVGMFEDYTQCMNPRMSQ